MSGSMGRWALGAFVFSGALALAGSALAAEQTAKVTFSKDVAPIFQAKRVSSHAPGSIAPMSPRTF